MSAPYDDELANNSLATGALFAVLSGYGQKPDACTIVTDHGSASNQLAVRFDFLKSAYRLTIERIADDRDLTWPTLDEPEP